MDKPLIPLANAHVNQITNEGEKTDWSIEENITNEKLGSLPSSLTDKQVFAILEMARKYELEAFNTGIDFGKKTQRETSNIIIRELKKKLEEATAENERIAGALDKQTKRGIR